MSDAVSLRDLCVGDGSSLFCMMERDVWRDLRDGLHLDCSGLAARLQSLLYSSAVPSRRSDQVAEERQFIEGLIDEYLHRTRSRASEEREASVGSKRRQEQAAPADEENGEEGRSVRADREIGLWSRLVAKIGFSA